MAYSLYWLNYTKMFVYQPSENIYHLHCQIISMLVCTGFTEDCTCLGHNRFWWLTLSTYAVDSKHADNVFSVGMETLDGFWGTGCWCLWEEHPVSGLSSHNIGGRTWDLFKFHRDAITLLGCCQLNSGNVRSCSACTRHIKCQDSEYVEQLVQWQLCRSLTTCTLYISCS